MGTGNKGFRERFTQRVQEIVGFVSPGLPKVSSSLQDVGILPTVVYFPLKGLFGPLFFFFFSLRGCLAKFWDEGIVSYFDPI